MADLLRTMPPEEMGIMEITPDTKELPLFEVQGDRLIQAGSAALPQDHPEETPYYSLMLLAVENKNGTVILVPMNRNAEKNPQGILPDDIAAELKKKLDL